MVSQMGFQPMAATFCAHRTRLAMTDAGEAPSMLMSLMPPAMEAKERGARGAKSTPSASGMLLTMVSWTDPAWPMLVTLKAWLRPESSLQ